MITTTTKFRLYVFDTLALAMASTKLFEYGTVIQVKGDSTRVKFGFGSQLSFDTPVAPTALTFAQLPWFNSDAAQSNTPLTTFAQNATGTITAANLAKKYITSTSAAAVTLTLPTATLLGTQLSAVKGTTLNFVVDNAAGANVVTVAVGSGITIPTPVITGGNTMTVAAGTIGYFRIVFTSPTAALLTRTA